MDSSILVVEEWRQVVGHPGYEVSSLGRVRCWRKQNGDGGFLDKPRLLKPIANAHGYLQIGVYNPVKKPKVHIMVLEAFFGPRPSPTHQAAHVDGNKSNNRLTNLYWATAKENCADRSRHRKTRTLAKLTAEMAREIKNSKGKVSGSVLARRYDVKPNTIYNIWNGATWKHVA